MVYRKWASGAERNYGLLLSYELRMSKWALPFELKDCVLTGYDSHQGEEQHFSKYTLYVATAVRKLCYVSALTSNF